jgi:hypothetical protein
VFLRRYNVHDCLQPLECYARAGLLRVAAYADLAYSGYGIKPRVTGDNIQVYQAETPDKNSADCQIIWDIAVMTSQARVHRPEDPLHILVASKDLGFRSLKSLVEMQHPTHKLTFVTGWHELRIFIE